MLKLPEGAVKISAEIDKEALEALIKAEVERQVTTLLNERRFMLEGHYHSEDHGQMGMNPIAVKDEVLRVLAAELKDPTDRPMPLASYERSDE